jgi:hypothetical protein
MKFTHKIYTENAHLKFTPKINTENSHRSKTKVKYFFSATTFIIKIIVFFITFEILKILLYFVRRNFHERFKKNQKTDFLPAARLYI